MLSHALDYKLATEQRLRGIQQDAVRVLHWLDDIAAAVQEYKETKGYAEATRKAGSHRQSGLTAEERSQKNEMKKARQALREGARLDCLWRKYELTYYSATRQEFDMLWSYWRGELEEAYEERRRARGNQQLRMQLRVKPTF